MKTVHFDTVLRTVLIVLLLCGVAAFGFVGCTHGKKPKTDDKSSTLSFHSFDGGGPSYNVEIQDPSVLSYTSEQKYGKEDHEELDGAGYDVIFTFHGLKSGSTTVTITAESPIMPTETTVYAAAVDEALKVTLTQQETVTERDPLQPVPQLVLHTETVTVYPQAADTDAARSMIDRLSAQQADVTLEKGEAGFGGALKLALPQAGETITARPGDLLLQGDDRLVLCTAEQTGVFTRLASLDETALDKLLPALETDPAISLWVEWSE